MSESLTIKKVDGTGIILAGDLNEAIDLKDLENKIKDCQFMDMQEVITLTSMGIALWIRFFNRFFREHPEQKNKIKLENCSFNVVDQFCYIPEFCQYFEINSIVVPFICEPCGAEFDIVKKVETIKQFEEPYEIKEKCNQCGEEAIISYYCTNYFSFIEGEQFKEA